jgi:hypothetical protein
MPRWKGHTRREYNKDAFTFMKTWTDAKTRTADNSPYASEIPAAGFSGIRKEWMMVLVEIKWQRAHSNEY